MERIRITTHLSVFGLIYQKYMKDVCINKPMNVLNHFYQSFNAVSDKHSVHTLLFGNGRKKKKIGDNRGVFAAVITDLFKAFDCIPHGLLIAKLNAFGFDKK